MPQWGHWLTALLEFKVSNAEKNTEVCDIMMSRHNIYVQAINYPTVARGEELLRIAPTPHHTPEMMKYFVGKIQISNSVFCLASFFFSTFSFISGTFLVLEFHGRLLLFFFVSSPERLVQTWKEVGLDLKPHSSAECTFCQQPLHFELMSEREKSYFSGLSHPISACA